MDPFAAALAAMFQSAGSRAATYIELGQDPMQGAVDVRVIVSQPDQSVSFGDGAVIQSSFELQIQRSQVPKPLLGALVTVDQGEFLTVDRTLSNTLRIIGEPRLDVEGFTWACGAEAV